MILVTGATGYLGQAVMRQAHAAKLDVRGVSRADVDLLDQAAVDRFLQAADPTRILHLAAEVPKTPAAYDDHEAALRSIAMVEHLLGHGSSIVFASSRIAGQPSCAYAWGKLVAECLVWPYLVLRLPGLFGLPRRDGVIYEAAKRGDVRDSYGPYPAMHVDDAAAAILRACADDYQGASHRRLGYGTVEEFRERVAQFARELAS